ncbi:MAG: hypothetical protein RQ856_03675 [Candidatus Izemoplasmatales bacterium]|nr:hypothetical protein [Candidatus Izemoplasmatales bacterium]
MTKKDILTKIFRIIIILSAIIGIILNASNSAIPSKQFIYFTLQSNVLVALVFIMLIFLKKRIKNIQFYKKPSENSNNFNWFSF